MRNRELRLALLLVLAGAALALLAGGRDWVSATVAAPPPLPPRSVAVSGDDAVPGLRALALLGLAGVAALAATRTRGRVALGALLALAGAGVVVLAVRALVRGAARLLAASGTAAPGSALELTRWPLVAALGGTLLALGGLVVAVRGRRWAALSSRYEAPAARAERPAPRPEVQAWEALDRGEDPTRGDPEAQDPPRAGDTRPA